MISYPHRIRVTKGTDALPFDHEPDLFEPMNDDGDAGGHRRFDGRAPAASLQHRLSKRGRSAGALASSVFVTSR